MGKDWGLTIGLAALMLLPACASRNITSSTQGTTLVQSGQVTAIRDLAFKGGPTSGLGAFVGAIVGGVAGSSIGSGGGSTAAGIGGAVVGGIAGQHLERSSNTTSNIELTVRLVSGAVQTYRVPSSENFRIGDNVKVTTAQGVTRVTHRTDTEAPASVQPDSSDRYQ
jgi:outer membrane lipoprotein SlyB